MAFLEMRLGSMFNDVPSPRQSSRRSTKSDSITHIDGLSERPWRPPSQLPRAFEFLASWQPGVSYTLKD